MPPRVAGEVCGLASAHSGRFACAFLPRTLPHELSVDALAHNLSVAVYECESSGGVEWLQEEQLRLGKCFSDK